MNKRQRRFAGTHTEAAMRRLLGGFLDALAGRELVTGPCDHHAVAELLVPLLRVAELDQWAHLWFRGFCPDCRRGFQADLTFDLAAWRIVFVDERASGGGTWQHRRGAYFSGVEGPRRRRFLPASPAA